MTAVTRGIKIRKPAAKAFNKPFSRLKTSSKSKLVRRTKFISKISASRVPARTNGQETLEISKISSLGTISSDLIEKINIEIYNDDKRVKRFIESVLTAKQQGTGYTKTHRVYKYKSQSRRRHRNSRHYLSESSINSEAGDRLIVSFLHYKEGTQPFLNLASRFPTV